MLNVHRFHVPVKKHGTHDQQSHAGGRGGGRELSPTEAFFAATAWNTGNNFELNYTENKTVREKYESEYSKTTNTEHNTQARAELDAVDAYTSSAYSSMNGLERGTGYNSDLHSASELIKMNRDLDSAIEKSPDLVGDKNLYRVYSDRVLEGIQPGDQIVDKGFLSTTRVDITGSSLSSRNTRNGLGEINLSSDTVAVIVPSPSKSGKGLIVDAFLPANGVRTGGIWQREYEVILPRNTTLTFLGFQQGEMERVAVFQRND